MNAWRARLALCFFSLLFSPLLLLAQNDSGVIFLVRHAEKVSNSPDALLSPAGLERAQCLARALRDAGVSSIYVTDVVRTQQTAAPLAQALNLKPTVVPITSAKQNASAVMAKLRREGRHTVLVVSHQDVLPLIIEQLGGGKVEMEKVQYDTLFVLILRGPHRAALATLHYCDGK
jgi:broad specificity phosphatase PhoE